MNFRGMKETAKESVDNGYKAKYRTKIYHPDCYLWSLRSFKQLLNTLLCLRSTLSTLFAYYKIVYHITMKQQN